MKSRIMMMIVSIGIWSSDHAKAQQWEDAVDAVAAISPTGNGTPTNLAVHTTGFTCFGETVPTFAPQNFDGPDHESIGPCTYQSNLWINLAAFARQGDLATLQTQMTGVQGSLDGLEAQMAAYALQGQATLQRLQSDTTRNTTGVAMSFAMAGVADLAPGETVAISANWGTFEGRNSLAGGFAVRASENVSLNGGIAIGLKGEAVGGRAGVRIAW